jgi:hypothetical protein
MRPALALATRGTGTVLVAAIVRPRTVQAIDEEAAAALARLPEPDELVWYVRSLNVTGAGDRDDPLARVRWALLDEAAGRPLATGVAGDPTRTSLAPDAPREVAGLAVRDVAAVLAGADAGRPVGIAAASGFLLAWTEPQACRRPLPGLPAEGCPRHAVLAEATWASDGPDGTEPPDGHLHALVPPGVAVPDSAIRIEGSSGGPAPAVVILRPSTDADCHARDACAPWVVERVTWAHGEALAIGRRVVRPAAIAPDDRVADDLRRAAGRARAGADVLLRAILLERGSLPRLDAVAARALRGKAAGEPRRPVWYVRVLDEGVRGAPRIRWLVLAAPGGRVLASGEQPVPGADPAG